MPKIYAIGETLLDIIFEDNIPKMVRPGGSTLNTVVSLGRLNLPVYFISEWANDKIGDIIDKFLIHNNVNTKYVSRFDEGKTALALAFLDKDKNASYSFYKIYPSSRFINGFPEIESGDIVLFASLYAVSKEVRTPLFNFIKYAKSKGSYIIYDPNFRANHLDELPYLMPLFMENFSIANFVRASNEDFMNIFNATNYEQAYDELQKTGCKHLIYTSSNQGVWLVTDKIKKFFSVPSITPVSTIGAGDTFNAGIIYGLFKYYCENKNYDYISENQWNNIINTAIEFATDVCLSWDNYISENFAEKYLLNE
jgi:fructokinase